METHYIQPPALLNITLPTCVECHQTYPTREQNDELIVLLDNWYKHHSTLYFRAYIESIKIQHGIPELYVCHLMWMERGKMKRLLSGKDKPKFDQLQFARFIANSPEMTRTRLKEIKCLSYGK